MAELSDYPEAELRNELKRRKETKELVQSTQQVRDDLVTALRAATACIVDNMTGEGISEQQLGHAARLVYELTYRCLPGGYDGTFGKKEGKALSGMSYGWFRQGLDPAHGADREADSVTGRLNSYADQKYR